MNNFCQTAPKKLIETQKWFASCITTPLKPDNKLTFPENGPKASKYISKSPTLTPEQRIELYHQQYWWRLIRILQENFPLVTRLFGYSEFNRLIAIPFLIAHPPTHWALARLGIKLPLWLENTYLGDDKELVLAAAKIDEAMTKSFYIKKDPTPNYLEKTILSQKLTLQSHVHLFTFPVNIFEFREAFLKHDVEFWTTNPFPELPLYPSYFILYRHPQNYVTWESITFEEFVMLSFFKEGISINEACTKFGSMSETFYKEAEVKLPLWFKLWISLELFSTTIRSKETLL